MRARQLAWAHARVGAACNCNRRAEVLEFKIPYARAEDPPWKVSTADAFARCFAGPISSVTIKIMQSQSLDNAWGRSNPQQRDLPTTAEVRQPASRPTSQSTDPVWNSAKIMMCGGISGAVAKTCTAPLARLTILYQVQQISHSFQVVRNDTTFMFGSPTHHAIKKTG